jgi:hypothetical protein
MPSPKIYRNDQKKLNNCILKGRYKIFIGLVVAILDLTTFYVVY